MMYRRLKDLREDRDLKQEVLAKLLNIRQGTYSKYELGQRGIPSEVWFQLADFYGTSVDYLMGRTDAKKPYPQSAQTKCR